MNDELKQRVIDEIIALVEYAEIPPNAVTTQDLMASGMSESKAWRTLRKLHAQGKYHRTVGPRNAMYYWPVEDSV